MAGLSPYLLFLDPYSFFAFIAAHRDRAVRTHCETGTEV
jgi:hypothetical protein